MTLEAWVNPAAGGCIYDRACGDVIMKYQEYDPAFDQTNLSYGLFIVNYIVGAASTTSGSQNSATGANDLPLNAWAHLATTYDGTSQRLYVNGALANDAVPLSGTLLAGTLPLFIGGGTIYDLRQFRGKIDEVRIYNRALSQTEILNDMVGAATPTLTSVSPTTGVQGTAVPVTLTGTNFVAGATVGVSNPGITVGSVTVVSATQITATFTIAANAAVGTANVTVTTSAGTSGTVAFIVNPPAPTLSTIAPTSGVQGAAVPVTLTGTNFVTGATVAVTNPGITVASVTVVGATQITATFTIAANAAPGPASVTVTTSGGTSAPATFTVVSAAEVISTPATPTGPVTGVSGTLYGFAASGSSSSLGHAVQYSFSWGDGTYSGWTPSGVTSSSHRWTAPGTYTVTVQARCTIDTAVTSSYSAGLAITITSESISVPTTPSGPGSVVTGTSYTYSTGGSVSSLGHQIHYLLIWGDGSISGWLPVGTTSASHTFFGPGTWVVIARAACTTDTQVFSPDSAAFTVSVLADKTISAPSAPSGPVTGSSGTSYTYSTGGAVSSTGSAVVYLFDWGDGKKSGWLAAGVTTAAHTWASPGSYAVTASAADATDVLIQSSASSALTVTMAAP
jgi:hypothetical protein